jgi:hypothetical protein
MPPTGVIFKKCHSLYNILSFSKAQLMNKKSSSPRSYPEADQNKTNRVAEPAAAAYTVARPKSTYKRRPSSPRRIAGHEVSDEVWRFAVANDLISHLETAIRLVRECFPTASDFRFLYEMDWEIENRHWITIEIKIAGTTEEILQQYNQFTAKIVREVPPEKSDKILLSFCGEAKWNRLCFLRLVKNF